jgi:mannitol-1-/sugar-/sorbitol-6-phosphatase
LSREDVIPCEGVLFDCDGVLVDSDASVISSWSRWARDYELSPEAVVSLVHGRRTEETVRELVAAEHRAAALDHINRLELSDVAAVRALAGAAQILGTIPHRRWAVVTSGTTALARARLAACGLPEPVVLVTADDVRRGKPDPEGYELAAALLALATSDVVVVEDTARGVEAARRAGVSAVIGVSERALDTSADVVVRDLTCLGWAGGVVVRGDGILRRSE